MKRDENDRKMVFNLFLKNFPSNFFVVILTIFFGISGHVKNN